LWDIQSGIWAVLIIILLPVIIYLPNLFGWWSIDPIHFVAGMASFHGNQILPGLPWIDPNVG